jgi:hypothetical protein
MLVRIGEQRWRFADSYRLLQASLAQLTRDFDVRHKKLDLDEAFRSEQALRRYNEHDCRGLYEVLDTFFELHNITSETIAAHAMRVFRAYYLRRVCIGLNAENEDFVRRCYFGGRVEIYRYDRARVHKYDVNSMYPCVMREPVPVDYLWSTRRLPDDDSQHIGFYHAQVRYPESTYLPALPILADKLYFPVGYFDGYFTSMELRRAIADGASVSIRSGRIFAAEPMLAEYAEELYRLKEEAERKGERGKRHALKILLNSFYGKFGQRREQRTFLLDRNQPGVFPLLDQTGKPTGLAWRYTESRASHILPHIAATITARARLLQLDFLGQAPVWYGDTDSLFTSAVLPTGTGLGEIKLEGVGDFQAYRLKEYRFDGKLAVKGIPRDKDNPAREAELKEKFLAGEPVEFRRHAGFRESVNRGLETVRFVEVTKQRGVVRDKRARIGDDTRPWRFEELLK